MATFNFDKAGMQKLEKELNKQFAPGLKVPTSGTEAAAVASVKNQLKKMGAVPNDAEVRRIVRDARKR